MPTLTQPPPPRSKISVNLSEEASRTLREMAEQRQSSTSDVIRESIAVYRFLMNALADGAEVELVKRSGSDEARERVHFVFSQ